MEILKTDLKHEFHFITVKSETWNSINAKDSESSRNSEETST
jgi:hypothetical protein